jgi:ATP-dependent RNA helicase DeaD
VNATRLSRFDDQITAALEQQDRVARFRDIIAHYVEHHDVPEGDVAAALAIVAQGETPLLLNAEDDRPQRFDRDRPDRPDRGDGDRPERRSRPSGPRTTYRLEVGKRQRVEPRQIIGALANEGGLQREDFGGIDIRPEYSLIELPVDLASDALDRLSGTRISGKLIQIRPDGGPLRTGDRPVRRPRQY